MGKILMIYLAITFKVYILNSMEIINLDNIIDVAKTTTLNDNIEVAARASVPELIRHYGYPVEIHNIITDDGYILELHRLPRPNAQPILLQHGVMDSSACWIIMGPQQGLAFILYNLGYDVWMGNNRGNHYSRKHLTLLDENSNFWNFTWHEMGIYDLPATIDYVIEHTGYEKLHYIAHSQGTTIFWVMCSERPEYNRKIISMQAMAPVAYLDNVKSPFIIALTTVLELLNTLSKILGINQFLPKTNLLLKTALTFCHDDAVTQFICSNIIFLISGYNPDGMNTTMLPVIIGHTPSGAAVKQMIHFGQIKNSGIFRQYDYGLINNLYQYGQTNPPNYNFSNVQVPVYFHYAENDWMATVKDVENLYNKLPNVEGKFLVNNKNFNHIDFLWSKTVKNSVYNRVINILKNIDNKLQFTKNCKKFWLT